MGILWKNNTTIKFQTNPPEIGKRTPTTITLLYIAVYHFAKLPLIMTFPSSLVFVLAIVFSTLSESTLSSNDSFSSESAYAALTQRLDAQQAQIDVLIRRSMQSPAACLGRVSASEFELYLSGIGIYTQVNTAHCQFHEMPTYLTSLGGMNSI